MTRLTIARLVLSLTITVGVVGRVLAMAQAPYVQSYTQGDVHNSAFEAQTVERSRALQARVEKIEAQLNYGLMLLVGNLVAHLFQITKRTDSRA